MSANFKNIKAGIKSILIADEDLGSDGVFNYEPSIETLNQDPFAVVVPSENESEFATTTENKRIYGFSIKVFVERASRGVAESELLLMRIIDRLINSFDESSTLSVDGVMIVRAAPSAWSYVLSDKEYRMAEIKLGVLVWYDRHI